MSTRQISKPTSRYYHLRAEWFEQQAHKFLSCGEKAQAEYLLSRADEYQKKAGTLPFLDDGDTPEPEVVSCLPTRCNSCDSPIYVPIHDFHKERNYCYPCAWSRLEGETSGRSHA